MFLIPDAHLLSSLTSRYPQYSSYLLSTPSPPPLAKLRQWNESSAAIAHLQAHYDQRTFNELPQSLRTTLARFYVRDLTVLSLYADAFIVSGKSNTGQLAMVIAGEDAVIGFRGLGGRIRSVDLPWSPVEMET